MLFHNQETARIVLKEGIVPFINAKGDASLLDAFANCCNVFRYRMNIDLHPLLGSLCQEITGGKYSSSGNMPDELPKIINTHRILLEMIARAVSATESDVSEDSSFNSMLKEAIDEFLGYNRSYKVYWDSGNCGISANKEHCLDYRQLEVYLITIVVEALISEYKTNNILVDQIKCSGGNVVARCPKCGKYFYKSRAKQEYCSEVCRAGAANMRHYHKSKKSD